MRSTEEKIIRGAVSTYTPDGPLLNFIHHLLMDGGSMTVGYLPGGGVNDVYFKLITPHGTEFFHPSRRNLIRSGEGGESVGLGGMGGGSGMDDTDGESPLHRYGRWERGGRWGGVVHGWV